jgi:protein-S-isoprenylcysteine O-methyltransferase Ste14
VRLEAPTGIDAARGLGEADRAGVQIPPPVIYIAGFLVGVALELAFPIGALPFALALIAGLVGGALWLAFDASAMVLFHRARTSMVPMRPTTALVTSGPYRLTRNPMYVGMAFLYGGLALALGMIWSLALLPAILFMVDRFVIAREERYLEAKFGDEYRDYKARVRRWL